MTDNRSYLSSNVGLPPNKNKNHHNSIINDSILDHCFSFRLNISLILSCFEFLYFLAITANWQEKLANSIFRICNVSYLLFLGGNERRFQ